MNTATVPSYTSCDSAAPVAGIVCTTDGRTYDPVTGSQTVYPGDASADLAIVKTPSGGTTPGSGWTFSLRVRNEGPSDAEADIVVTDTLPAGLTFASSGADWACVRVGQVVTCTLESPPGSALGLAAGATAPDLVISVLTAWSPANASYPNTATVESTVTADPNPGNNTSTATVTVAPTPPRPTDPTDPVTPVTPVDPTDPTITDPTDPTKPGKPTPPGRRPQRPSDPLTPPRVIAASGVTVLLPGTVETNAGRKVRVSVVCRPLDRTRTGWAFTDQWAQVPRGDVGYCRVSVGPKGKVRLHITYPPPVLVKVTYYAPAAPGYTRYHKVVTYVTRAT